MKLTKAQQHMVDRALKHETRTGGSMYERYGKRAFNWDSDAPTCDLRGSAQIRCAYRLQELGLGFTHSVQPFDVTFFRAYRDDAERVTREEEQKAFWDKVNRDWSNR